ncbi:four helix bundle protein [Patescibacteria group bacterium]|nr:four helix bundle protein [Patescibacteria group bacterium]
MKNDKEKFKNEFKKRIYRFVLSIISYVDELNRKDPTCRVISEQLIDSGTGIISNYSEAQVSSSKKDFTNYFHYCLKCCNETKVWIGLLRDSSKANKEKSNVLLDELNEISNIFGSSLLTLKDRK